ncbi:chloride channel protein [Streptomyces kaniharaensis]|uniref:Chloride channel protein n=1 Tax=Streptomyces kaniharaensis TaxID=212423 RepID=A0A6N7KJK2_9ACTN|nr:chloride channel protein [Streptomyces kaniharaensis]MQS11551.1 chloride channel protein [Streptomyces kaniharaensis]
MPGTPQQQSGGPTLHEVLLRKGYFGLLLIAALVGIPVSLAAFGFVSLEHQLQHWVWESLPDAAGFSRAPWWWPMPALLLAGLLLAPVVTRLPGHGGHIPVVGFGGGPSLPRDVPGVVLAALAGLPLGVVLGPEAPLMAMGSGLALLAVRSARRTEQPQLVRVLGTAGSAAAISTIFGSPLVAGVMMIEAAGLGGPRLVALILPCLLASGVGALVFTGFGHWTGLSIGALALPSVPKTGIPDPGDFLWGIPLAVTIAVVSVAGQTFGRRVKAYTTGDPDGPRPRPTARQTAVRTVLCAVAVGACLTAYALLTGRSPEEAALSGQATLSTLAADPAAWPIGALLALVLCKGVGWGIALGSLRGGPIFPAILLGAALGVACAPLPGFGTASALAAGLAASAAAVTRLPLSSTVLATALLGGEAANAMPLLIVAAVTAFITGELLRSRAGRAPVPSDRTAAEVG